MLLNEGPSNSADDYSQPSFVAPRDRQERWVRIGITVEGCAGDLTPVIDVARYLQGEGGTSRDEAV